jgi:hypothetical protein
MSEQYLLECKCGRSNPVSASHAGRDIRCGCGKTLDVPPLRVLRRLPVADAAATAEASVWSGRQRLWVLGALLIAAGVLLGGFTQWNKPPPPNQAVAAEMQDMAERVRQQAPNLSVSKAMEAFYQYSITPLRTLDQIVETHPYNETYADRLAMNRNWMIVAWGLVGLGVLVIASTHVLSAVQPQAAPSGKLRKGGHAVHHG